MEKKKLSLLQRLTGFQSKKNKRERKKASPLPEFISQPPENDYIEKIFRLPLSEGRCKLNLTSIYGNIVISGYERDMVCAKVMYKPKKGDGDIKFTADIEGKYFLDYDEDNFVSVWVEVHVPPRLFREIQLKSYHGKILVTGVSTGFLSLKGSYVVNKLKNVFAVDLLVETIQKSTHLINVSALNGKINVSNGSLNTTCLDVKNLNIKANNSPIAINARYDRQDIYKWDIKSRFGKVDLHLPNKPGLGYYVLAEARANGVKMALRNMDILIGGHNFIEARSKDYKDLSKKVSLELTAIKAPIVLK
ncbi:MAG: DUF4097 domain-containing protein [Defluviitaleaceae bacterium]|nr:DUF4097 domain-containing protein [Defluviitaleaceae bacterium]